MLANILRKLRFERGWTQQQLANNANVSIVTVNKIEKGQRPSAKSLNKLLKAFCMNVDDLLKYPMLTPEEILYLENKKQEKVFYYWSKNNKINFSQHNLR